jgi:hypothetical protein
MQPAEAVKASAIYNYLSSVRPELVLQITEQELEGELREMEDLGFVRYDAVARRWSCDTAFRN